MEEVFVKTSAIELEDVNEAARKLRVSKTYLYKLPPDTPGVYVFGRAKRFCVDELKQWARERATQRIPV